jgi:vacuolar-type H+-ATPase subunit E/Vma4
VDSAAGADGSRPQMVEFIKQEANEKAHEILIKVHSMPGR